MTTSAQVHYLERPAGESRFGMLETIRVYGLELLTVSGDVETIRQHHADYISGFGRSDRARPLGSQCEQALMCLEAELDNLRAALAWNETDAHRTEIGLRLLYANFV